MGKNLLENFWTKTPVEATALINKALRSKTVEAIGEARKQVAAEMFGELDEWDNRTDAEKRAPYDGPTPRGKHSHRCTGCKKAYGQTNAVACYKKNCNAPKLTDSCSHCRSAMEKALSKNEAERLTPTVADKDRPSQKQYNSMSKKDKWNAPMPWPKERDGGMKSSSAIGDFSKTRAPKTVKAMDEAEPKPTKKKKDSWEPDVCGICGKPDGPNHKYGTCFMNKGKK